ncbi:MAG: long-chain fatty acid--CoA ligase [Rhodospirillales bacterium]|nr:long-chain fatty acid--CoA ligase [Rhodospirillales bacterium]
MYPVGMTSPLWLKSYPAEIDWYADIPAHPVHLLLERTAAEYPSAPAFDFLGKKYDWATLHRMARALAAALQARGVGKGTKVGLFLPNTPSYLVGYYAIAMTGATIVNYNPLYPVKELAYQIENSETDILITCDLSLLYDKALACLRDTRLRTLIVSQFANLLPFPKNILFPLLKSKDISTVPYDQRILSYDALIATGGAPQPVSIDPFEDIALLQYTGGTTGVPKGAMLTHANIVGNAEQGTLWCHDFKPGQEKMLGILPFFHVFAMTAVMNLSVRNALEIIALPRFELEDTIRLIHKKRPDYMMAVPAIFNAINNYPGIERYNLQSLKACISGGAPMPVEIKKSFEDKTGCTVVEGYGLTESSPITHVNPLRAENRAGSIGMVLPRTEIKLIDPETGQDVTALKERGELCIKGPQVMKGYWNNPDATAKTLQNGWLHTGDIATLDEDGYTYIVDRLKDMIITNGYNVYPRNVEEAIYLHPSVEECIVAGVPHPQRGEVVKAWIKCKEGRDLSAEDLKTFLKDHLSPMEIPRLYEFRKDPLPKTMIGKLSRKDVLSEETS